MNDVIAAALELREEPEIMARLEQKIAHHNQPFTRIKRTKRRKDKS
jgi:hypothetical protein